MTDPSTDQRVVQALLAGDAAAFEALVDKYHATMLRVVRGLLPSTAVAEEVVQEAWVAILDALPRFEGRSSLRTWMFRILLNRARTRAGREARSVPFSAFANADDEEPVDADRFDERGYWRNPPDRWATTAERLVGDHELVKQVEEAIDTLPERQRAVLLLRDVDGWSSEEVRNALDLSDTNQRVLLHRARAKVRAAIEQRAQGQR
jgi:RNA polymerase sigma-70 factor (ECF subfamily)